jgi:sulfatase maturation enzyme AslB (radical SAM superfamily)
MDTNGQADESFLRTPGIELLDEVSFSIDGFSSETHDYLRGAGTFNRVISSLRIAQERGIKIDVTTCGHRRLLARNALGETGFEQMIKFCENIGVERVNFHILFKHGFPMDTWSEDTDLTYIDWVPLYNELIRKKNAEVFKIDVRLPQHFVHKETFEKHSKYYGYCAAKLGERVLVHPDGMMRVCSGLISTKYGIAKYYDNKIVWDRSPTNELSDHDMNKSTPCTNQSKTMETGKYLPLCFSFKPNQTEVIWKEDLQWECKRLKNPG